ncbi:hypothetical protein N656DRAFT_511501 [Canariomyces notabilis]|nr:hypothetical protein N656DRAFT_511501 [Canariomyces arenarius]
MDLRSGTQWTQYFRVRSSGNCPSPGARPAESSLFQKARNLDKPGAARRRNSELALVVLLYPDVSLQGTPSFSKGSPELRPPTSQLGCPRFLAARLSARRQIISLPKNDQRNGAHHPPVAAPSSPRNPSNRSSLLRFPPGQYRESAWAARNPASRLLHDIIMTTNRSPISSPRWRFILWVLTP